MRKRIYEIIEVAKRSDVISRIYDWFLIAVIVLSIVPIIAKLKQDVVMTVDTFALVVFVGDYLLRWLTADYKYRSKSAISFVRYPFSLEGIVGLLVIISLLPLDYAGSTLGLMEVFRTVRIFHVFRLAKYSKSVELILKVFRRQRTALMTVVIFVAFYILTSALVVFTAEPATFDTFFDAIYWSTASLTTVGYGEAVPVSWFGRAFTMLSSLFGVLVVALPTGIITAGFVKVTHEEQRRAVRVAAAAEKAQAEKQALEQARIAAKVKKVEAENRSEEKEIAKVQKAVEKISKKWKTL